MNTHRAADVSDASWNLVSVRCAVCVLEAQDTEFESKRMSVPVAWWMGNNEISTFHFQRKYNVSGRQLREVDDIQ